MVCAASYAAMNILERLFILTVSQLNGVSAPHHVGKDRGAMAACRDRMRNCTPLIWPVHLLNHKARPMTLRKLCDCNKQHFALCNLRRVSTTFSSRNCSLKTGPIVRAELRGYCSLRD